MRRMILDVHGGLKMNYRRGLNPKAKQIGMLLFYLLDFRKAEKNPLALHIYENVRARECVLQRIYCVVQSCN